MRDWIRYPVVGPKCATVVGELGFVNGFRATRKAMGSLLVRFGVLMTVRGCGGGVVFRIWMGSVRQTSLCGASLFDVIAMIGSNTSALGLPQSITEWHWKLMVDSGVADGT